MATLAEKARSRFFLGGLMTDKPAYQGLKIIPRRNPSQSINVAVELINPGHQRVIRGQAIHRLYFSDVFMR